MSLVWIVPKNIYLAQIEVEFSLQAVGRWQNLKGTKEGGGEAQAEDEFFQGKSRKERKREGGEEETSLCCCYGATR